MKKRKIIEFEPGDVVMLKSGGPSIVVCGTGHCEDGEQWVRCSWITPFDLGTRQGERQSSFLPEQLKLVTGRNEKNRRDLSEFAVGDVVRLGGIGPKMTVSMMYTGELVGAIQCQWFQGADEVCYGAPFDFSALELAE